MKFNNIVLSASSLEGDKVKNAQGEDLGNVKDIMINTERGQVQYYVLSFGGILGMGDKLFAIPPQAIAVDNRPNMADEAFRDEVYAHYGYEYRV